ncbi:hypothetical protein ACFQ48_21295 [Hymenobacter caeli]|uniref:DUF2059 domain-containing protein n=1 Tax=Hymenobacter caeli TaxID=2735894 RepID=A0ABX2FMZ6_9BACT|nr:hypothetical protein [Hymenobacter caeli]NRT18540.1 hypothetical protein [Hymenobacter caeli]
MRLLFSVLYFPRYLFPGLLCLSLVSSLAVARQQRVVVPDSVRGQGRLVKQLVADACQRLSNRTGRAAPDSLSPAQAYEELQGTLSAVAESHGAEVRQLAGRTKAAGAYNQLRADLPDATAQRLVKTCSVAAALYGRFSRLIGDNPMPTKAEKQFVQAWSNELCQRFAVLNQEGRLQGKTGAELMALFEQEYSAASAAQEPKMARLYGGALDEKQGVTQKFELMIGNELGAQMKEACPQILRLLNSAK